MNNLKKFIAEIIKFEIGEKEFYNQFPHLSPESEKSNQINLDDLYFDYYYHRNLLYKSKNEEERNFHQNKMNEIEEIIKNVK